MWEFASLAFLKIFAQFSLSPSRRWGNNDMCDLGNSLFIIMASGLVGYSP